MSRRSRRQRLPTEPVELTIESLSHEGRGVARIDGKVAFVAGALAGETVLARYTSRRSQFDELQVEEVIEPASERCEPPCEYAAVCGGCSLQHLQPEKQLDFKQSVLLEHLQQATGLGSDQFELIGQLKAQTLHYRRKARLAVRVVQKKGGVLVGFREKSSSFITDMQDCQVLVEDVARLIQPLRQLINELAARFDIPQIEVAVGETGPAADAANQVALVLRHLRPLPDSDQQRLKEFAQQENLHLYLQPGGTDSVHRLFPDAEQGPERLTYFLPAHDLQLQFHPMDFTQVNASINRLIVDQALHYLQLDKEDRVLDLFCGLGNFTLAMAKQAAQLTGVEGSEEMVRRGQENAALNGLTNTEFAAADLSKSITEHHWAQSSYDKILLDPPRSGAQEIIAEIAALGARRIVYVSCNPITLARDSNLLLQQGYDLKSAGVMDMFPHTTHVESMAVFERNN
ncbi:MAG: 23S rRNA (uracil(1939)-C(5))-methyltransferase RlmD [Pseudomonadales bacterium]|nr:23S rRNA (uracil(1939)-C(5))-methyltransferase RlmD [Pseudomonadales bacterium]